MTAEWFMTWIAPIAGPAAGLAAMVYLIWWFGRRNRRARRGDQR